MSENNGDLTELLTSLGVAFGLAQKLNDDPWVTYDRIMAWQQHAAENPGIAKPGGFIANQLRGHVEPPPPREKRSEATTIGGFWERMRSEPEFREAYCKKWGIDY